MVNSEVEIHWIRGEGYGIKRVSEGNKKRTGDSGFSRFFDKVYGRE